MSNLSILLLTAALCAAVLGSAPASAGLLAAALLSLLVNP